MFAFTGVDTFHHRNVRIFYTDTGSVLDANEQGELFKYCACTGIFLRIADLFTCGCFSSARRERVFKAMQTTLTKINDNLQKGMEYLKAGNKIEQSLANKQIDAESYGSMKEIVWCGSVQKIFEVIPRSNLSRKQQVNLHELTLKIDSTLTGFEWGRYSKVMHFKEESASISLDVNFWEHPYIA